MYPWIRATKVGAMAMAGSGLKLTGTSRIALRVWPGDLDAMVHMNNGRYLSLMDLGRLDLALRSGLVGECRRQHWLALLAAATARYWRPLKLFTGFELTTRLVWWDAKWLYLQHEMRQGEHLAAQALAKLVIKDRQQSTVAPARVLAALGADPEPPKPPMGLAEWDAWEEALKQGNHHNGAG